MGTADILTDISNLIILHPSFLDEIKYEDLYKAVYLNLQCLRQLYPKTQMETVLRFLEEKLLVINKAFEIRNPLAISAGIEDLASYIRLLPDSEFASDYIERSNLDSLVLDHIKRNTIWVIGDSHVNFFSGNEQLSFIPVGNDINTCRNVNNTPFSILHMGPCLAYNSNSYGTSSQFREKLDFLLSDIIEPAAKIMFVLGEIDIRAHVFKECERQNCDYRKVTHSSIENYIKMMKEVCDQGFKVLCFGPIASQSEALQTEDTYIRWGSEVERNRATAYFNDELEHACESASIGFVTILKQMITDDWHTKTEFISSDGVHLSQSIMPLVISELEQRMNVFERRV